MLYAIEDTLREIPDSDMTKLEDRPFVAVVTPAEWASKESAFDMGIDFEPATTGVLDTQAEVNYDSITGAFYIPDRVDIDNERCFSFALDEKGIVFIDEGDTAASIVQAIRTARRWRNPSLERFIADFLLYIVRDDTRLLKNYERKLDSMEAAIVSDEGDDGPERTNEIRSELRDLDDHYEHLMDLAQVLEENENGFFKEANLRYFRVFYNRVDKLRDQAETLRDQTMQIRDLYKMHLDIKQNNIMTVLTVVTAIFAPLTLIVGWYGMNFVFMPELELPWSYPVVFIVCVAFAIGSVIYFKKKHWL